MKTNLTKFSVICEKAGFLSPRSSKIIVTKEKETEKERARRRKGGEEKTSNIGSLLVFIIANLEIFFGQKQVLDAKGLFDDTVINNQLDDPTK